MNRGFGVIDSDVGGLVHIFPYLGNAIIPTDELICFRGVGISPARMCFESMIVLKQ